MYGKVSTSRLTKFSWWLGESKRKKNRIKKKIMDEMMDLNKPSKNSFSEVLITKILKILRMSRMVVREKGCGSEPLRTTFKTTNKC